MIRSELSLAVLAAFNVALATLNQLLVFTLLGSGADTDALVASATIPLVINTVWTVAIPAVLVPKWAGEPRQIQVDEAFLSSLALGALASIIVLTFVIPARWWATLLFGGFSAESVDLCARLLRIQMWSVLFTGLATIASAVLHARARFHVVEGLTLVVSATSLAGLYVLLPRYGVDAAAWLTLARSGALLLLSIPLLGCLPAGSAKWKPLSKHLWDMRRLVGANMYFKLEPIVDRYLLSSTAAGTLSLYGIAQLLHGSGGAVLGKVWGSTAVTRLAEHAKARRLPELRTLYYRNLILLVGVSLAAVALLAIGGALVLPKIDRIGQMTAAELANLWQLALLLAGVLVGASSGTLLAGAFYAVGDTRTPTRMSILTFTLFVPLKCLAFYLGGVAGLCVATSLYYITNACMLFVLFRRRMRVFTTRVKGRNDFA